MSRAWLIGCDPGTTGAVVVLRPDGAVVDGLLMPTMKVGSNNRVNAAALAAFLGRWVGTEPMHAYIEKVQAMPGGRERKMGAASAFTFGHAAGILEGVISGAGIPITLVAPASWKKAAGLIGTDKDAARARAIQLYPELRALDAKGKGQALADAILIARYGAGLSCAPSGSVSADMVVN